jgi:hypothetical protein
MPENLEYIKYDTLFFERYARISLIELVDERFVSLKNADRPDLQDKERSVGIEVTRAIREDKNVAHALINDMVGKPTVNTEGWLDVAKYGYTYGLHKNMIGEIEYAYWSTALPLRRIVKSKVDKVANGFYGDFDVYGLYVFVKEELEAKLIKQLIEYIIKLQAKNEHRYSTMYISQISDLFVCNLKKVSYEKIPIDETMRIKFYKESI